jgi:DNA-binding transcriptional ArsR family regulator
MRRDAESVSASVFAALADPTRRAILAALAEHGPSTATDLGSRLGISRQGVTKHLDLLYDAGLVTTSRGTGRRVLYRHRSEPIKVAQSFLAALATDWDTSLDRLNAFLASEK